MVPGLLWLQLAGSRVHGFSSYPWHVIPRDLSSPARDPTLSPALEDRFLTLNLQGSPATVPFKHMIGYTWVIEYRCVATYHHSQDPEQSVVPNVSCFPFAASSLPNPHPRPAELLPVTIALLFLEFPVNETKHSLVFYV